MDLKLLHQKHQDIYGDPPNLVVYAPGRVNLIGEHVDYQQGYVLPVAINMGIYVAISKNPESEVLAVYSVDKDQKTTSMYTDFMKSTTDWFNYPMGVIKVLRAKGHKFGGVRISFTGNLPIGVGLSSSAALEVAVAYAVQELYKLNISGTDLALICQEAENQVVGVRCGIMDQYISRMAEKDKALLIDCKTLKYRAVPLNLKKAKFIITNSNSPHKLTSSLYNERVRECEEAVKIFAASKEGDSLRDFTMQDYEENKNLLPEIIRKRAFHVISENERVLKAEEALKKGNLTEFGKLMNDSHASLKVYYEVSSPQLDWLTEAARSINGCYGSRLTGGGFGGCTISLFEENAVPAYKEKLKEYEKQFGYKAIIYESTAMGGVQVIK